MKPYYSPQTFIRHAGNESLLWNRRTSACSILKDAKPFLDAVSCEPLNEDEIIRKIAKTFECKPDEVAEDVREFLKMLVAESLVGGKTRLVFPDGQFFLVLETTVNDIFDRII